MDQTFFNADIELFIDHRVNWERMLRFRRGPDVSVSEEVDTYKMILRTASDVCSDIQAGGRDHWHEEVKLVDGVVKVPAHIAAGYEKLRSAGLTALILSPEYGGAGLPLAINSAFLEMLSRADSSLMTFLGLQTGLAADIDLAHVYGAGKAEAGRDGGDGKAVLAGSGLRDQAPLAHVAGEQRLAEAVVDLVSSRLPESLLLQVDLGPAQVLREPLRVVQRRRSP